MPAASSCRRACALSGRAPEKVGWLYSIGHLVRTGVFLLSTHAGVGTLNARCRVSRADRVRRAAGGTSPSPSGPRLKALKSNSFNLGLKRSYSPIFLKRRKAFESRYIYIDYLPSYLFIFTDSFHAAETKTTCTRPSRPPACIHGVAGYIDTI